MSWADRNWAGTDDRGWRGGGGGFAVSRPQGVMVLILALAGAHLFKVVALAVLSGGSDPRFGQAVLDVFGYRGTSILEGHIWAPLSYQFVHAGFGHLFWNCLGIFIFGRILEGVIGKKAFLVSFFACGALAVVWTRLLPGTNPDIPVVGASGSLNAILGILLIRVPNLELNLLIAVVKMKWIVGFYIFIDVVKALGDGGGPMGEAGGVAVYVHLGGVATGALYAWAWPRHIEPWWTGRADRARRKKEVAEFAKRQQNEQELDRILEKINREGMDQLTQNERAFLKRRSEEKL